MRLSGEELVNLIISSNLPFSELRRSQKKYFGTIPMQNFVKNPFLMVSERFRVVWRVLGGPNLKFRQKVSTTHQISPKNLD